MDLKEYTKPEYYRNRELSWIGFNERVLSEARDKSIPLFERLKFLSITASNLDEFFMIRVASLKDMVHAKYTKPDIAGLSPKEQLAMLAPVPEISYRLSTVPTTVLCFRLLEKQGLWWWKAMKL